MTYRNPTYFVTSASGQRYVLRKKPSGALMSKTAHAIEREYRILDCVGKTGKIPVPKMYCLCMDEAVLGTPFYVCVCPPPPPFLPLRALLTMRVG